MLNVIMRNVVILSLVPVKDSMMKVPAYVMLRYCKGNLGDQDELFEADKMIYLQNDLA